MDNLTVEEVTNVYDCYSVLKRGSRNIHFGATSMNDKSSRSHSVFTLYIKSQITENDIVKTRTSKFNLVDLAGSEK